MANETKKMKKIALIYDFLSEIGGLERIMFFFANELSKKYEVELVFAHVDEDKKEDIVKSLELNKGIKIISLNSGKNQSVNLMKTMLNPSKINKIKADLIISHSFLGSKLAREHNKKFKTPYMIVMHHPPNFLYSPVSFKKWVNNPSRFFAYILGKVLRGKLIKEDREFVENALKNLVSTKHTIERVKKIYGTESELLYPAVSSFFKPLTKKQAEAALKAREIKNPFILFHSRIIPDKRPDLFLELVRRMQDYKLEGRDLNFIISGDISKEMLHELHSKIREMNLKNIQILGKVTREELLGLYNCARVFCVTAQKEDFGLTPIEAIACGTPIVAWDDQTGPSEIIAVGKAGFLAKPYDMQDYVEQVRKVLKKKWNRKEMMKSIEKFSEARVSKNILKAVENAKV